MCFFFEDKPLMFPNCKLFYFILFLQQILKTTLKRIFLETWTKTSVSEFSFKQTCENLFL